MQRQIIHVVPYFIDGSSNLYLWDPEAPAQRVGTYNKATDSITYSDNHLPQLTDRLQVWREKQFARPRKPGSAAAAAAANGRGNSGRGAAEGEGSDDDE